MNYILALLLPPVAIAQTGRPGLGFLIFPCWVLALVFWGSLSHPVFVLLAWLFTFQSREGPGLRD